MLWHKSASGKPDDSHRVTTCHWGRYDPLTNFDSILDKDRDPARSNSPIVTASSPEDAIQRPAWAIIVTGIYLPETGRWSTPDLRHIGANPFAYFLGTDCKTVALTILALSSIALNQRFRPAVY